MRVIAGSARRLQLKTLEGMETRPTTDRIKETLFNMINQRLVQSQFLDCYSGSGGIGIEALSRGADRAVFIEKNPKAAEYIRQNGNLNFEKFFGTLDMEITHAMELYIDEVTASKDWESAVLAKTNLLHEATKYMAEEMGRIPTIEELSEYTKISREEIKDIMGLSEDARRVAQAEEKNLRHNFKG